ncbi:MAG: aminotransferase class I/II-fold pyridoxal phosphate-dependent enzyme [Amylibacter sp.]|jgi:N-succinyldiaminopimelate aminotransferase|nr:aminotransferase class I/II-fold pyridoxal phosphate-dependent enzyme [Amylibacter sp.]
MQFPERFSDLPEYAFPRLRALLDVHPAGGDVLPMSLGEPKHAFPAFVTEEIVKNAAGFGKYPPNDGAPELLSAISDWVHRRYSVRIDAATQIISLNGTREGLFNACIATCPEAKKGKQPNVLMPNPFYQVYAVATMTAGATPVYVNATAETGFLPDFATVSAETLDNTSIVYLCSPSNPQGAVATSTYWRNLLELAEKHDFRVFADECYSEIYRGTAPTGAIEVAQEMGADPERLIIFHSLSKRSNLPGLRSGFAASGPKNIAAMKQLRNYAGTPLPTPLQHAAIRCWNDEDHVIENRALYGAKFTVADEIFGDVAGYVPPQAGFFLWLPVKDSEAAALKLWKDSGVRVLPGDYLGRDVNGQNPGDGYIRVAMVAPIDDMTRGLKEIHRHLYEG